MAPIQLISRHMWNPSMTMDYGSETFAAERAQFIEAITGFAAGATVAVIIRLLIRWRNGTKLAADDLSISLSLLPLWALVATGVIIALHGGMGLEAEHLSPVQRPIFYQANYASNFLYVLTTLSTKLSILLLYKRIFTQRPFRLAIYAVGSVCICWAIAVILATGFQCSPTNRAWDLTVEGACLDLQKLYYGTSISNMILDMVINVMPLREIWKLQINLRQKILLMVVMSLGLLSVAASIARILSVPNLVSTNVPATISMPFLYTVVEPAFAIICACLATYRPLFLWLTGAASSNIKSFLSSSSSDTSQNRKSWRFSRHSKRASGQLLMQQTPPMQQTPYLGVDASPDLNERASLMRVRDSSPANGLGVPRETFRRSGRESHNSHWADDAISRAMADDEEIGLGVGPTAYRPGPRE